MNHTIIIAEAGVNHNGSKEQAYKLIDLAKDAGADYVKFQTFKANELATNHAEMAAYQATNLGNKSSQQDMLRKLELPFEMHEDLISYCKKLGIGFLSTAFDFESLKFLSGFNMDFWKIPSGEITNYPYLEAIGKTKKSVILSTGMSTEAEVSDAIKVLLNSGTEKSKLWVLHCTSEYPAPFNELNLNSIPYLKNRFDVEVGYSDHSEGIEASIAAVALGATIIEKHFTLDKNLPGPDHKASLAPDELFAMVKAIRNVEKSIGTLQKTSSPSELKNKSLVRKSIVAKTEIKIGDIFSVENLTTKRPGTGKNPMEWPLVIGQKATKNYQPDDLI
jgi:N,N'-diacetyllegionaminate synthase